MYSSPLIVSLLVIAAFCGQTAAAETPKTVVQFSRKWDTCDANDHALVEGFTKVIWAHGRLSSSGTPMQHTERGAKTVRFRGVQEQPSAEPDTQTVDLTVSNVLFNASHGAPDWDGQTNYFCQFMSVPSQITDQKSHITRFDFLHQNGDVGSSVGKVHHIIVYECDQNHNDWAGLCKDPNMPQDCKNHVVAAWALGVGTTYFPPNTGMPMGGSDGFKHILMELHYDNFDQQPFSDSSGFRFHYTHNLRAQEVGVINFGSGGNGIAIPANTNSFEYNFECPSGCTNKLGGDLNVWGTMLHAHQHGKSLKLRQIRDGVELAPLSEEKYFDFNLQYINQQAEARTLKQSDSLILNCRYDNPTNQVIYGGEGSLQEMCFAFIYVWPRQNMKGWACNPADYKDNVDPQHWSPSWTEEGYKAMTHCPAVNASAPTPANCHNAGQGDTRCLTRTAKQMVNTTGVTQYQPPLCNRPTTPDVQPQIVQHFNQSEFTHTEILNPDSGADVKLYWSDDQVNEQVHFAIEYPSDDGWVGLGWSDQGGMQGADMAMAWIDNSNQVQISDRYATERALPVVDTVQDFYNVKAFRVTNVQETTAPPSSTIANDVTGTTAPPSSTIANDVTGTTAPPSSTIANDVTQPGTTASDDGSPAACASVGLGAVLLTLLCVVFV